ncbi:hypothetical protein LBMAG46_39770 [Planctomycetia bacterium]|nr:hypothetical protein LBMAG46_39770 [Planctomycetia bacterium]
MLRISIAVLSCIAVLSSTAFADISGVGGIIVTPSLVGIDYSVTPGTARVTINLNAKSDSGNPAAVSSYTFVMSMGGAPGSSVSATTQTAFFNSTNFDGGTIGAAQASFSAGSYTFKGDRSVPSGLPLAITDELVGTAVFDITQSVTATSYNVTLPALASTNGFAVNSVTGANLPLVLNINAYSGGGGGAGGGAAVPEPGSVLAFSAVLGGLGIRALRRRRQAQVA